MAIKLWYSLARLGLFLFGFLVNELKSYLVWFHLNISDNNLNSFWTSQIAAANKTIIPSMVAMKFPDLEANFSDGRNLTLPIRSIDGGNHVSELANPSATLLCLSFRASSQVCKFLFSMMKFCILFKFDL